MNSIVKFILPGLLWLNFFAASAQSDSASVISPQTSYETELKALNVYLAEFDNGFYGHMEVVDGQIQIRFREGKFSRFFLEDMNEPELNEIYGQVSWDCLNDGQCVTTDWSENGKESGILFSGSGSADLEYLMELLDSFIKAIRNN